MNIRDETLNQLEQFGENNLGLYATERNFDYGPQKRINTSNLSKYITKTTTFPKIQEAQNHHLFKCIYYNATKRLDEFDGQKKINCDPATIDSIKQELFKRFFKPIYFPLIALICCLLIFTSKESINYSKFKFYLFFIIVFILIISEISLRYSTHNKVGMLFFILFPILSFFTVYFSLIKKLNYRY